MDKTTVKMAKLRKHWISVTDFGAFQFKIAFTFSGSISRPSSEMIKPRKVVFVMENSHFSGLMNRPASLSFWSTLRTYSLCSFNVRE